MHIKNIYIYSLHSYSVAYVEVTLLGYVTATTIFFFWVTTDKNLVKEEKKKSQTSALQILGIICYCFLFINFSENSSKHRILKLLNDKDLKTQNKKIYQIYDLSNILQYTEPLEMKAKDLWSITP